MRVLLIAVGNRLQPTTASHTQASNGPTLTAISSHTAFSNSRPKWRKRSRIMSQSSSFDADADAGAAELRVERPNELPSSPFLSHVSRPADIGALSRALFEFMGRAFVCSIPVDKLVFRRGAEPQRRRTCDASCRKTRDSTRN